MKNRLMCLLGGFSLGVMAMSLKAGNAPELLWIATCAVLILAGLFSK